MSYYIKAGYFENLDEGDTLIQPYTSVPQNDQWQVDVYKYASNLIQTGSKVLELGCGSGKKLVRYLGRKTENITGVDYPHSIAYCRSNYNIGKWVESDFDKDFPRRFGSYDLIMAIDVIEHLLNPNKLLEIIKVNAQSDNQILLSTPDRDALHGFHHVGPPSNLRHVREWNMEEFSKYLTSEGFKVEKHFLVNSRRLTLEQKLSQFLGRVNYKTCQVVLCNIA